MPKKLKIIDNVDLKELEKFGFEYDEDNDWYFYYGFTDTNDQSEIRHYVYTSDRTISTGFDIYVDPFQIHNKIYELIKANLIEEVGE